MLAQARELAAAHLELRAIRQTLTVIELRVEMLEKQREGKASVWDVWNDLTDWLFMCLVI